MTWEKIAEIIEKLASKKLAVVIVSLLLLGQMASEDQGNNTYYIIAISGLSVAHMISQGILDWRTGKKADDTIREGGP